MRDSALARWLVLGTLLAAPGCGGDDGGPTPPDDGDFPIPGTPVQLSFSASDVTSAPAWSRDSSQIAYCAGQPSSEVWVIPAQGGTATQLYDDDYSYWDPAWSPTEDRIVYTRGAAGSPWELWVKPYPSGDAALLVSGSSPVSRSRWSHNGTVILYHRFDNALWQVPVASGTPSLLYSTPGVLSGAAYAPDATRIAFSMHDGESYELYTMAAAGGTATQLAELGGARDPSYSPDGRWIAFWRPEPPDAPTASAIWVIAADGHGGAGRITSPDHNYDLLPSWSPDGSRIAFVSDRDFPLRQVWVVAVQ